MWLSRAPDTRTADLLTSQTSLPLTFMFFASYPRAFGHIHFSVVQPPTLMPFTSASDTLLLEISPLLDPPLIMMPAVPPAPLTTLPLMYAPLTATKSMPSPPVLLTVLPTTFTLWAWETLIPSSP